MTVAVLRLPFIVGAPEFFQIAGVGLFLLDREFLRRIGADGERDLDRFRVTDGSRDLMGADGPTGEPPVSGVDLTLGMADLDESPGGRGVLYHADADAHDVVSGRKFLGGNDHPAGSVGELQIGAAITMRQGGVVFVIGEVAAVSLGVTGGGLL